MSDSTTQLERDVRELRAREALKDLNTRYSMAIDDRRIEDFGACFTEDGKFTHVDGTVLGREAIMAYQRQRLALYGPTFHYPDGYVYEIDGDVATGVVLAHSELAIDGAMYQVGFRYHDVYRRDDGQWRFAERGLRVLYFSPFADLPGVFADRLRKRWPGAPRPADFPEGDDAWEAFYA